MDSRYDLDNVEELTIRLTCERSPQKRAFSERLERVLPPLQSNLRGRRHGRKHITLPGKARVTHGA